MIKNVDNKIRIIFEIANNHQGSVDHFKKILDDIYLSTRNYLDEFEFLIKFQFRDIPTFIDRTIDPLSNKHISRFNDTILTNDQWKEIINLVKEKEFTTLVTPFDEISVNKAIDLGIQEFKVASCSCVEWSLLREVVNSGKPVTISTGGRNLKEIDEIYSYFAHLIPNNFTLMHCCGIYPAPKQSLNLKSISKFKERYPLAKIGYSGHEDPDNHLVSSLAITLGAEAIERHIGKEDLINGININKYSINSSSINDWLEALLETKICLGHSKDYKYKNNVELDSLETLQRGVFVKKDISKGSKIKLSECDLKFPIQPNQVSASEIASINKIFVANDDIKAGTRLTLDLVKQELSRERFLRDYVHKIRGIINQYGEYVPSDIQIEVSHHYGVEKVEKFGCCLLNVVNRSYCKKLIIMTQGQEHPTQFHNVKEETFRILYGELELNLDGESLILKKGDETLVRSSVKHSFKAKTDCIIEELSTTSIPEDSFYEDSNISNLKREDRKTNLNLHFDHFK